MEAHGPDQHERVLLVLRDVPAFGMGDGRGDVGSKTLYAQTKDRRESRACPDNHACEKGTWHPHAAVPPALPGRRPPLLAGAGEKGRDC